MGFLSRHGALQGPPPCLVRCLRTNRGKDTVWYMSRLAQVKNNWRNPLLCVCGKCTCFHNSKYKPPFLLTTPCFWMSAFFHLSWRKFPLHPRDRLARRLHRRGTSFHCGGPHTPSGAPEQSGWLALERRGWVESRSPPPSPLRLHSQAPSCSWTIRKRYHGCN